MRSREVIEKRARDPHKPYANVPGLTLEVLLDIRDLLQPQHIEGEQDKAGPA